MAFTDEDLKRLKETDGKFWAGVTMEHKDIAALLARLEAAEAHINACEEFHGFDNNDQPFVDAWRKAAGKP